MATTYWPLTRFYWIVFFLAATFFVSTARAEFLYVANSNIGSIGLYDTNGATYNASLVSVDFPTGVALDKNGDMYVSMTAANCVSLYTSNGVLINQKFLDSQDGTWGPGRIVLDGIGNMFVVNGSAGTVGKYTTAGGVVNSALVHANYPTGLALDASGNIYVSSWTYSYGYRIGKYTPAGAVVNDSFISALPNGTDLAFDGQGHLLVAILGTGSGTGVVRQYDLNGNLLNGSFISGLSGIQGMQLDGKGHLFLAQLPGAAGSGFILEYTISGSLVNRSLITGLDSPGAMAIGVPEPLSLAVLGLGAAAFLRRRRSYRK